MHNPTKYMATNPKPKQQHQTNLVAPVTAKTQVSIFKEEECKASQRRDSNCMGYGPKTWRTPHETVGEQLTLDIFRPCGFLVAQDFTRR
jgi:hypothetical protein